MTEKILISIFLITLIIRFFLIDNSLTKTIHVTKVK